MDKLKKHMLGKISYFGYFLNDNCYIYASGESEQKCACNVLQVNQPISLTILGLEGNRRIGSSIQIGRFRVVC